MNRKKMLLSAAIGLLNIAVVQHASATILYNPVVTQVGDGNVTVGSTGYTTTINIFYNTIPNQVAPISAVSYNSAASGTRLINSASATSEATLSNNPGLADKAAKGLVYPGTGYVFSGGYDAANATANISTTADAPRSVGSVTVGVNSASSPTVAFTQTEATTFNNDNFRSATGDDAASNFWGAGNGGSANAGWRYLNTTTKLNTLAGSTTNTRTVEILGGQLFGSTSSGTQGIYSIGTGTPTTAGQAQNLLFATGAGSSPYEFVLIDDPANLATTTSTFGFDTAYVADDRTPASGGGIQKWTYNGTAWSLAYTMNEGALGTGYRGLAGQLDTDTNQVVLWATTGTASATSNKLQQVTDIGASSTFITLASAPANTVFRGVALSPVPEPSSLVFGGLGIAGFASLLIRRRRNADNRN